MKYRGLISGNVNSRPATPAEKASILKSMAEAQVQLNSAMAQINSSPVLSGKVVGPSGGHLGVSLGAFTKHISSRLHTG